MKDDSSPNPDEGMSGFAIVDLAGCIRAAQIQAMTRTLARVLVAQAIAEHGIKATNDENA
jgi:hypothetical protein